ECRDDALALGFGEREGRRAGWRLAAQLGREVVDVENRSLADHERVLDGAPELADVAGPRIAPDGLERRPRHAVHSPQALRVELADEVPEQRRDAAPPVA